VFVLYVDLSGFTAYTERRGEKAAAELASAFCAKAMHLGRRRGLRPIKTVGDAVIFTARDAETAAEGALALAEAFDGSSFPLNVHIGIASGEVVERDGDVFGFPVNMAAHLSSSARPGEILVSAAVAELLPSGAFVTSDAGTRDLKGASRAVRLFNLLRLNALREVPL
jgi:adenylate cyclase